MTLQEILNNRSIISAKVTEDMKDDLKTWGFSIRSFEIKDIKPSNLRVRTALSNQINAQQSAKEKEINADSDLVTNKIKYEGEAQKIMREADGVQAKMVANAEGQKDQSISCLNAESTSLKLIIDKAAQEGGLDVLRMHASQD